MRSTTTRLLLTAALAGALGLTASPLPAGADPAAAGGSAPAAAADRADGVGAWRVSPSGPGAWQVSWRSPRRLPVGADRPTVVRDGVTLGVPTLGDDGRTVTTTVISTERPDPARLDVVLSGDRLDHVGSDTEADAAARVRDLPPTPALAADPADPGEFDVVSSDYELPAVKLPRMPEPIEMVGHVVEPAPEADTGPRPLVVFLHGRHSYCYDPTGEGGDDWSWPCQPPLAEIPSHLGYDYIQQVLASQGYATVSIRVNGINAQDYRLSDGGADARARVVQRHLDHWAAMAGDHQVDLSRVVLVGHSRGGEGVNRASIQIPLDAPYRIAGQVLLAPTDFGTQTAPYVPTVTVLPYCDGDVYDLQGQRFTDSARDLAPDDTSLKSSVMVLGANHNFFNTEWTPGIAQAPAWDDWSGRRGVCGSASPSRLDDSEQRAVGVAYVAGAVQLFAGGDEEVLPLFDGSSVHPTSIGAADVRSHAIGGGRDVRRPAIDAGLSLAEGADTAFCQGVISGSPDACGRTDGLWGNAPHWYDEGELAPARRELELHWSEAGQSGGLVFEQPLDLSDGRLELRTIVDPTLGDVRLHLRLTDAEGASAEVTPEDEGLLRSLPLDNRVGKRWAQPVVADPSTATGLDLTRVTRVDLVGDSADGRVWVLDVAAAPDALASVPEKRLPTVSLGSLTLDEGDDPEVQVARVPFTIENEVTRPATMTVGVQRQSRGGQQRIRVDLAPGQTEGSLRFEYSGNTVDDFPRSTTGYYAFPVSGLMTDVYDGRVTVLDDDPAPKVRVSAPRRVREGGTIRIRVAVDGARSYDIYASGEPVRGPGSKPRLSTSDVPARWLERHYVDPDRRAVPLHRAGLYLYDRVRPRDDAGQISVPVRADGVEEGVETVTFKIRIDRLRVVRTVRVRDR